MTSTFAVPPGAVERIGRASFLLSGALAVVAAAAAALTCFSPGLLRGPAARFPPSTPVSAIAGYLGTIAILDTVLWLARIVPTIVHNGPPGFLDGTGLPTNPVFVQDLAWWLPLALVGAGWLWRRKPWGYLAGGAILVMWAIEGPTVAVDQWWGHAADPGSPVVSVAAVPLFAALTVIGLVPLDLYFRSMADGRANRG